MQPQLDMQSIMAMIDKVCGIYAIDRSRIYLSGLSDGGTFCYSRGFDYPNRFAAIAPIAGVLSPRTKAMLRAERAKSLPIHIVHGRNDMVFPIETDR